MRNKVKNNPEKTDTLTNRERILDQFKGRKLTINELIDELFLEDVNSGMIEFRTWKYYVHLNKLFTVLEKTGQIRQVGYKQGPTNRPEKLWIRVSNETTK